MRFDIDYEALERLPPDQRRTALARLRDLGMIQRSNPLWGFDPLNPGGKGVPHLKQHRWMKAHTVDGRGVKRRVMWGGNRSGKTTGGVVADIIDLCDASAIPPHLLPYKRWHHPMKMFFVANKARNVDTIAIPKFQEWFPKDQLVGGRWNTAYNKELMRLTLKNGSWLQFMTQAMDVDAFQGADLHRVHFDEEPLFDHGRAIWAQCLSRTIDHNGDILITMTPEEGMTWMYDEIYEPWEALNGGADEGFVDLGDAGMMFGSVVDMDDNPTLDEEGKAAALAGFTAEEREAKKSGRFVSFSGKIYDRFDKSKHVVPDHIALQHAQAAGLRVTGLDPGFRHQAGLIWVAQDKDGVWVYAEEALKETVISGVAATFHRRNGAIGFEPLYVPADPAILKRDAQTGKSDQQAYAEAGLRTVIATNDVRPGINRIKLLLEADRLFVAASCEELIKQFGRYRWKKAKQSENAAPEAPVKRDDHLLDALRYAIMAMPQFEAPPARDTRPRDQQIIEEDIKRALSGASSKSVQTDLGPGFFQ